MKIRLPRSESLILLTAFLIILICGIYPLARLWLTPWIPDLAPPQSGTGSTGVSEFSVAALINTTRIGIETALLALTPAFALAFMLERRTWRGGRAAEACLWILFLTPSYLITGGWQIAMSQPALLNTPVRDAFYGEAGIVALLALKGLPFACLSARTGWAAIGGELGAAARIHIRNPWRRALVLSGLLMPVAGACFAIVFIEGISDFGVAATLGDQIHLPLVIYGIYSKLSRTPVNFAEAARLSLVLVALAGGATALHQYFNHRISGLVSGRSRRPDRPRPSCLEATGANIGLVMLAIIAIGVPVIALIGQALFGVSSDNSSLFSADEASNLLYSFCYAFTGAVFSLAAALGLMSLTMRSSGWISGVLNSLTVCAMAVPTVVLGASYVIAFNGFLPLYGTPVLLVMGYVASHLPVLTRFLTAPMRSVHANIGEAGRLHGLSWAARLERLHMPLLLRPLLWAWAITFGGIFFELPLSSLLHPPGRDPLGGVLLFMDETLNYAAEARLALAGVAVCLAVISLVVVLLPQWLMAPAHADAEREPSAK